MKTAVIYWSGTGNTESMANEVVSLIEATDFDASQLKNFDTLAFGCPAMGSEVLEESEFEPMFESCESKLNGRKIALFGSYGWGDGEWMRSWEERCTKAGAELVCDSVICTDTPDDEALAACNLLGAQLA